MNNLDIRPGDDVKVVSGPHEGRAGRVLLTRPISIDQREAEDYAIVEYRQQNCFNEVNIDQISVPVRRLARTR